MARRFFVFRERDVLICVFAGPLFVIRELYTKNTNYPNPDKEKSAVPEGRALLNFPIISTHKEVEE